MSTSLAALKTVSEISFKEVSRDLWRSVHLQVQGGKSLSESLKTHPKFKKSIVTNLIEIGEETGELDSLLLTIARGMERNRAIKGKILGALLYPCFVFIISLIAAGIAVFVVIPQLEKLITAMGRGLHPVTQLLLDLSVLVQKMTIPGVCIMLLGLFALIITFI